MRVHHLFFSIVDDQSRILIGRRASLAAAGLACGVSWTQSTPPSHGTADKRTIIGDLDGQRPLPCHGLCRDISKSRHVFCSFHVGIRSPSPASSICSGAFSSGSLAFRPPLVCVVWLWRADPSSGRSLRPSDPLLRVLPVNPPGPDLGVPSRRITAANARNSQAGRGAARRGRNTPRLEATVTVTTPNSPPDRHGMPGPRTFWVSPSSLTREPSPWLSSGLLLLVFVSPHDV